MADAPRPRIPAAALEQFSGPWLMAEDRIKAVFARLRSMPVAEFVPDDDGDGDGPAPMPSYSSIGNGMVRIDVCGVLTKYPIGYGIDEFCGLCPTMPLIDALNRALADWTVRGVVFVIDSPGGMVAGTNMLAEAIAAANATKPCYAVVSDLAASGGYYIASQCQSISCNAMGEVGCIGVYTVLADWSKFYDDFGVKLTVVSSGGVKGLGADGTVNQELIDDQKRGVMAMYDKFVADVAAGRGMSLEQARTLGDGRCWIAREALTLGLIDSVASVDAAVSAATQETQRMNAEAFKAYAAANPEAAEVKDLITKGFASGKAAGVAEGTTNERARATGILGAHGLTDHAAVASITAGHDVETATVIANTAARAKADAEAATKAQAEAHKAEVERLNKEIEKAKFEASGAKGVGISGAVKDRAAEGQDKTPDTAGLSVDKAAEVEFDADPKIRAEFDNNKRAYVKWRVNSARGSIRVLKGAAGQQQQADAK